MAARTVIPVNQPPAVTSPTIRALELSDTPVSVVTATCKEERRIQARAASTVRRYVFDFKTHQGREPMLTLPIPLLISWLIGLFSLAVLAGSIVLLYRAARQWIRHDRRRRTRRNDPEVLTEDRAVHLPATSAEALKDAAILTPLIAGAALLVLSFAGGHLIRFAFPAGKDEPMAMRTGTAKDVTRPDGTRIHAELYGPADAPVLLFTHGWGANSTEWYYAKRHLSDRFRLVLWDLPGLGESTQPQDRNFALDKMASDLHAVMGLAKGKPVVLVGHSIGGMINLTFCRLYPDLLRSQVAGIVQVDTTYTNPVETTKGSEFSRAIQKPVAEPLLHATILLSPVVRLMTWLSYENGLAYIHNAESSFGGSETRGQLDLVSRYQFESSPAVVARGTLAMFHWDATPVLPHVSAPALIIVGQQDTTTLPRASEYMQKTMPHAELKVVSPSAHYGLLEQHDAYDAAIAQFASTHLNH
jgi:pimeloyl-ACP methyl ester carboxylesterase